jgi:sporulation protein YlmC with PRC-barrel domain
MRRLVAVACGLGFALTTIAPAALAQNDLLPNQNQNRSATDVGPADARMSGSNIRASKLIGMNIENTAGESVGQINDIVLDGTTGKIRYAAVTYGGFLGIGNKMFAVPYEAFQWRIDPNNRNRRILNLNVTKEQMDGAVGFDEANWPDFADQKYTTDIDRRYGIDRSAPLPNTSGQSTNPPR